MPKLFPFHVDSSTGDRMLSVLHNDGFDDPTNSQNAFCYVLKRDFEWCAENLPTNVAQAKCREEWMDFKECQTYDLHLKRNRELIEKRNAKMRKGGWLPPHGERQFNLLRHMSREDQAPLGQRWEQLDKKKYLEEVMAGKSPHFK